MGPNLLNSSALYNGPATITVGILLELNCVRHLRGATYDECASWVHRLFQRDSVPHSGTIRKQWVRIVRNASNAKGDRNAYAKLPYRPPCKPVPGPASKPPVSDTDPTNGQPALAAGNSDMVPAITQIEAQCEKQVLSADIVWRLCQPASRKLWASSTTESWLAGWRWFSWWQWQSTVSLPVYHISWSWQLFLPWLSHFSKQAGSYHRSKCACWHTCECEWISAFSS